MRHLHNIEKSGFHRGQYVGYAAGHVWRIRKSNGTWLATCLAPGAELHLTMVRAATLVEMSMEFDKLEA